MLDVFRLKTSWSWLDGVAVAWRPQVLAASVAAFLLAEVFGFAVEVPNLHSRLSAMMFLDAQSPDSAGSGLIPWNGTEAAARFEQLGEEGRREFRRFAGTTEMDHAAKARGVANRQRGALSPQNETKRAPPETEAPLRIRSTGGGGRS